jgi:hypothetical protein
MDMYIVREKELVDIASSPLGMVEAMQRAGVI